MNSEIDDFLNDFAKNMGVPKAECALWYHAFCQQMIAWLMGDRAIDLMFARLFPHHMVGHWKLRMWQKGMGKMRRGWSKRGGRRQDKPMRLHSPKATEGELQANYFLRE